MPCSASWRWPSSRTTAIGCELGALRSRHAEIAETLLSPESARLYLAGFDRDCHDLEGILHTVKLTRSAARNVSDLIAGYGEIWSTKLFHRFFEERGSRRGPVQWIDARRVVVVEWGPLGPGGAVGAQSRAEPLATWWTAISRAR